MPGFLGDKETMIVHHLAKMVVSCEIYKIKHNKKQYFTPDSLEIASELGFSPCKYCN